MLINMLSPTCVPNLVTLARKLSPGMPKLITSLNAPLCAYSMRQSLHSRPRPRTLGNKYPCHIPKWSEDSYGRGSATGNFQCVKLKMPKTFTKDSFGGCDKPRTTKWQPTKFIGCSEIDVLWIFGSSNISIFDFLKPPSEFQLMLNK